MFFPLVFLALYLFAVSARAALTDSHTCTDGWCTFETPDATNDSPFGAIVLNGPSSAISDLTPAAGWRILDCNPASVAAQTVRLVCESENELASSCGHLFEGGAVNTIVKLPDNCGGGPFARVASISILSNYGRKAIKRSNGSRAIVRSLTFDYDFTAIPETSEPVTMHVVSTNIEGQTERLGSKALLQAARSTSRRSAKFPRNGEGFYKETVALVKRTVDDVIQKREENSDEKMANIDVKNQTFPAISGSIDCPGSVTASVTVTPTADVHLKVVYGYSVSATLVPLKIDDFAVHTNLAGNVTAVFNVAASVTGTFDTGTIDIFSIGLPGLSVPGLFTIGPQASIQAQFTSTITFAGQFDVATNWQPDLRLVFPPEQGKSNTTALAGASPFKLAIDPASINQTIVAKAEAHLIPRLDFGVEILGGLKEATVFLQVDTSITAQALLNIPGDPRQIKSINDLRGCIDVDAGIAVQVGVDADLTPFFSGEQTVDLLSLDKKLFQKCIGSPPCAPSNLHPANRKRDLGTSLARRQAAKLPLACVPSAGALLGLVDQVIGSVVP